MSQTTRSIGAGLCLGAYLMTYSMLPVSYFKHQLQNSSMVAFEMALKNVSATSSESLAANIIHPLAWAAACLGLGLLISGIVLPLLENTALAIFGRLGGVRCSSQAASIQFAVGAKKASGAAQGRAI